MIAKLKCWIGNYNGNLQGMIAANSQRAAVNIIGTTIYDFVRYWHETSMPTWPDFKPFTLYVKPFDSQTPWAAKEQS